MIISAYLASKLCLSIWTSFPCMDLYWHTLILLLLLHNYGGRPCAYTLIHVRLIVHIIVILNVRITDRKSNFIYFIILLCIIWIGKKLLFYLRNDVCFTRYGVNFSRVQLIGLTWASFFWFGEGTHYIIIYITYLYLRFFVLDARNENLEMHKL